ncbi:DNA topoisomerase I, mitochondrial [Rhipicephalus microplus]|uniref:DNA topoisomerase I, mitochondrial n=1 Tax=Rhipicephalus microplus TaxID=6941 RepID=UPI003F6D277F
MLEMNSLEGSSAAGFKSPSGSHGDCGTVSHGLTNGVNGVVNSSSSSGHHKSSDKHNHSSSSSSKHHKSSKEHRDDHHKHKDRHKDKHKDKDREREKDKEKEREKSSSGASVGASSSSTKHKEGHHVSSSKGHSTGKEHKTSSSSSSKPKDALSSSSSVHKSTEVKKDSSTSKESKTSESKHKDSSSSSKDKERHKDKHKEHKDKDKHKDKEREKHKSSSEKHRDSTSPVKIKQEAGTSKKSGAEGMPPPPAKVKTEVSSPPHPPAPRMTLETETVDISEIKGEVLSDDDVPLSARKPQQRLSDTSSVKNKRALESDSEEDEPLAIRSQKASKKSKSEEKVKKKRKADDSDYEDDIKPAKKASASKPKKVKVEVKAEPKMEEGSPKKKGKTKKEEEVEVWKWWEEEKHNDGKKWHTLEHRGPVFAPAYEPLPDNVRFYYDGVPVKLSPEAEEVAGFYGRMLDHDYTSKDVFNKNFFHDWRKCMTSKEAELITDLKKCNFKEIDAYYKQKSEERKAMTKEEKQVIKVQNEKLVEEYGFCIIDGHKQKIGNFKIEPPGLFRGRGEHPKMGMLKRRIMPEDVIINIGKEAKVPDPPPGHKWKEVRHDDNVSWLSSWTENILGQTKYIMLNPSSKLKGEKDMQKYEMARKLKSCVDKIRQNYMSDWKSKEMRIRQRSVALYFIDKLALRAGNEKEEGETADTVGCCSLRVEHITLHDQKDGKEFVVEFDFLGKDSIRYVNAVPVEKRVFKNLKLFMENKKPQDDLFDRLNTSILNKHLNELMEGLTAKVFRTYNASKTLQEQLELLTEADMSLPEKMLAYNRANRAVAILCNHQRAVPKTFGKQMENLQKKMEEKEEQIQQCKVDIKQLKSDYHNSRSEKDKQLLDRKKKRLQQLEDQMKKLEVQAMDKEENKQIALGTSKLNYLDPRISVAWCKKWNVPIDKIYNKTQRDKFRWAIEMAGPDYKF